MPRFITLGDTIEVPYKIILADPSTNENITGRVWITNADDTAIHEIETYKQPVSSNKTVTIRVPDARWETPYIRVYHEISHDDSSDQIVQTIPLRTSGLIYRQGESSITKQGEVTFDLPPYRTATMKVQ
jgi:hypothetical protein